MSNEETNRKAAYRLAAELINRGAYNADVNEDVLNALFKVREALLRAGAVPGIVDTDADPEIPF